MKNSFVENNIHYKFSTSQSPKEIGWERYKYLSINLESKKTHERCIEILGNEKDFLNLLKHWNRSAMIPNFLYAPID